MCAEKLSQERNNDEKYSVQLGPNYRVFKRQPEQQKHHILFIAILLRAKTSSHFRKEVNTNNSLRLPQLLLYFTIGSEKQR